MSSSDLQACTQKLKLQLSEVDKTLDELMVLQRKCAGESWTANTERPKVHQAIHSSGPDIQKLLEARMQARKKNLIAAAAADEQPEHPAVHSPSTTNSRAP